MGDKIPSNQINQLLWNSYENEEVRSFLSIADGQTRKRKEVEEPVFYTARYRLML